MLTSCGIRLLFQKPPVLFYFRKGILFAFLLTITCVAPAQPALEKSESGDKVYRAWNNKNGLPQNTVFDITQDHKGYLWGATEEGLFRFDGAEFSIINSGNTPGISSSIFYDLLPQGNFLWAAGRDFVIRIGDRLDKIIPLNTVAYGGWIKCLEADDKGRIWIGTSNGGVFYIKNDSVYSCSGWDASRQLTIEAMVYTPSGMFIGTSQGLYRMKDVTAPAVGIAFCGTSHVLSLAAGSSGRLWAGTAAAGLYALSPSDSLLFNTGSGLKENAVFSLFLSGKSEDSLWIGYRSRGLQLLNAGRLVTFLPDNYDHEAVRSVYITKGGSVWMGTNSSGLLQMKTGTIKTAASYTGLAGKVVLPMYQHSSGDIWVGTAGRGVTYISGTTSRTITQADGLSNDLVLSVQGAGNYVYIGTSAGLNRYNLSTRKVDRIYTMKDGLTNNWIISLFTASDGRMWITTRVGGLHYLDHSGNIHRMELPGNAARTNLIGVYEDRDGVIWFGTRGGGMIKMEKTGQLTQMGTPAFPADVVYDFLQDTEGDLWVATDKGLVIAYEGAYKVLDKTAGLLFNEGYRLLRDSAGYIWMSGNLGLQRMAEADLIRIKKMRDSGVYTIPVQLFNDEDGMPNSETNGGFYPAGWALQDGSLWFPTVNGVAIANGNRIVREADPLQVHIQSLRYGDNAFFHGELITVSPGVLNFEIRYTCIDFTKATDIRYYYRVKGYNNEWVSAGNRHVAFFSSLPPGYYTFEVKAERYGEWSPVTELRFRIQPHFYQTFWFNLLMRALFISAIVLVIYLLRRRSRRSLQDQQRLNMAQITGQEKERQFISKELHDNVNQQLSTAKIYLNYLRSNPGKREDLLEKSEEVVQKAITEIRQLCNALTPPGLKDIGLKEALEDLVNSYTMVGSLRIHLEYDERLSKADEDLQFVLYRISQEALNNVTKHAGADTVWLHFEVNGQLLHITVRDNGKGFDPKTQKSGVGFENIRNRLNLYQGKLDIKSAPGKGCILHMQLNTKF